MHPVANHANTSVNMQTQVYGKDRHEKLVCVFLTGVKPGKYYCLHVTTVFFLDLTYV